MQKSQDAFFRNAQIEYSTHPFYCQLPKELLKREIEKGGFSILSFNAVEGIAIFNSKEGFVKHIHSFLPHLKNLPTAYHEELLNDIGARFLEWNILDQDGCVRQEYETYEIILNVTSL